MVYVLLHQNQKHEFDSESLAKYIMSLIDSFSEVQKQYRAGETVDGFDEEMLKQIDEINFDAVEVSLGTLSNGKSFVKFA